MLYLAVAASSCLRPLPRCFQKPPPTQEERYVDITTVLETAFNFRGAAHYGAVIKPTRCGDSRKIAGVRVRSPLPPLPGGRPRVVRAYRRGFYQVDERPQLAGTNPKPAGPRKSKDRSNGVPSQKKVPRTRGDVAAEALRRAVDVVDLEVKPLPQLCGEPLDVCR